MTTRVLLCGLFLQLAFARVAFAQAEPAPPGWNEPASDPAPKTQPEEPWLENPTQSLLPRFFLSVSPRLVLRPGDAPADLPRVGYGGGLQFSAALLPLGPMRGGLGFAFAYDRVSHQKDVRISADTQQFVAHASFAFSVVLDGLFARRRVRPWLSLGGGFSVADYHNPAQVAGVSTIDVVSVIPLFRAALGVSVLIAHGVELGGHGEALVTFSNASDGVPPKTFFEPGVLVLTADIGFRF